MSLPTLASRLPSERTPIYTFATFLLNRATLSCLHPRASALCPDPQQRTGKRGVRGLLRALLVVVLCGWCSRTARAQQLDAVDLGWEAPETCPQRDAVVAAIHRWLEQSLEPLDPSSVSLDALVRADGTGFVLELTLESPSGESSETLRAQRCETFLDAVGLKVALAATPPGAARRARPKRRARVARARVLAAPGRVLAGADAASAAAAEPSSPTRDRSPSWVVGLRAAIGFGVMPGAAPGLDAELALQLPYVRAGVGFVYHAPVGVHYQGLPNTGADIQLFAGGPHLCIVAAMRRIEYALCAGYELGVMRGTGFGVTESFHSDQLWSAARLGPSLRIPLVGALGLAMDAQVLVAFTHPSYLVRYLGPLYDAGGIGLRGAVGLDMRL